MRTLGPKLLSTIVALTLLSAIFVPAHCLQCKFKLAAYSYNLCPLLFTLESSLSSTNSSSRLIHIHKDIPTPPTITRNSYDIDLGGEGLKKDPDLPETDQCPEGTWICLRISNIHRNHPSDSRRIIQVIPISGNIDVSSMIDGAPRLHGVNATARLVTPKRTEGQTTPVVEVALNGGWYLSRPQRAVISFHCDKSTTEPSMPVPKLFQYDFSSTTPPLHLGEMSESLKTDSHGFTWNTKHACPIAQEKPSHPTRTGEAPSESSHTGKGNQGDEGNVSPEVPLADRDGRRPMNAFKAAGIIIGSLLALAICYEIYVTQIHRRKQQYLSLSQGVASHAIFPSLGIILPPFPSLSWSISSFLRPFRRSSHRTAFGSRLANRYDPLVAEEYEIQDEDSNGVVDFQRQGLLQGRNTDPVSGNGYGSVR